MHKLSRLMKSYDQERQKNMQREILSADINRCIVLEVIEKKLNVSMVYVLIF